MGIQGRGQAPPLLYYDTCYTSFTCIVGAGLAPALWVVRQWRVKLQRIPNKLILAQRSNSGNCERIHRREAP